MKPPSSPASNSEQCDTAPVVVPTDGGCRDVDKPVNGRVEPTEVKAEVGEGQLNGADADGSDAGIGDCDEDLDAELEAIYTEGVTVDTKDDDAAPEDWESCYSDFRPGQYNPNVFVPCHTHPLSSRRKPNWTVLTEGQFDDADM